MAKRYTLEITKESRAMITLDAENLNDAHEKAKEQIAEKDFKWAMEDHVIIDVINTAEIK